MLNRREEAIVGCRLQVAGYRLKVTGCKPQLAGLRLLIRLTTLPVIDFNLQLVT